MKPLVEFIKSTLIGGLLVILPTGVLAILVMKIVEIIKHAFAPIDEHLPAQLHFPTLIAFILLLIACLFAGLIAQTRLGRGAGGLFERGILNHIPGYATVRSFARRV